MIWCAYCWIFYFNFVLMYTNHSNDNNFIVPLIEVSFFMLKPRDYDFFILNILNTILYHLHQCWKSNWKSEYCLSIYFCFCVQNVFDDVLLLNFRSRYHSLIFRSSCYAIYSTPIHRYAPAIRKFKRSLTWF